MRNRVLWTILLILIICLFVGCSDSNFDTYYKQFKESYISATEFIEKDNDSLIALKKMDASLVGSELKKMKEAMEKMSSELKSESKKGIYGNVKNYYQGVEFLLYAYNNFDKLTTEEKIKVDTEVVSASLNRKSIKRGDE